MKDFIPKTNSLLMELIYLGQEKQGKHCKHTFSIFKTYATKYSVHVTNNNFGCIKVGKINYGQRCMGVRLSYEFEEDSNISSVANLN